MRRPKPKAPPNVPEGTISFGGPIGWFSIALVIFTDTIPNERLSSLLRCQPTDIRDKGVPLYRPDGTIMHTPKHSRWHLKLSPEETDEWDVCEAAKLLLARVNGDPEVWREISGGGQARLSFGLEMDARNLGFDLDPELMRYLGDRNIRADFDVYADDFDLPTLPPSKRSEPTSH